MTGPRCRFCGAGLDTVCVDLGVSPLANSYVPESELASMEPFYPLRVLVCRECFLVQVAHQESPERIFSDYAYFSAYSTTWLEHCERYVDMAVERYGIGPDSQVVELASNDGSLLRYFVAQGIPALGIEPAQNVAEVAIENGVPTLVEFFGREVGERLGAERPADLMVGNNVLAHVPDINSFVAGMKAALAHDGVITMEFPHLLNMLELNQFDTIYHEHFSYLSVGTAQRVFNHHDLRIFDVEPISTHGGSVRIHACHAADPREDRAGLAEVMERERNAGLEDLTTYEAFGRGVVEEKHRILKLLVELKAQGARIIGYGAPAKGNTLLNYCGIRTDFLDYTTDLNPEKQGHYLPGVRIPILAPDVIERTRPDYVFVLPWNIREEVMQQLSYVREWGGRFIVRAPNIQVFE